MINYLLLAACIGAPILLKAQTWKVQITGLFFQAGIFEADMDRTVKEFKGTGIERNSRNQPERPEFGWKYAGGCPTR